MGVDDVREVHVEHDVGAAHDDIGLGGALEHHLVRDDVAQQEAQPVLCGTVGVALQQEQAALLAVELPLAAGAEVVDEGAVVARKHDADGADARVHHVGEREVDQAVAAHEGAARERPALQKRAFILAGVVSGDISDSLAVDHRIIPPFR